MRNSNKALVGLLVIIIFVLLITLLMMVYNKTSIKDPIYNDISTIVSLIVIVIMIIAIILTEDSSKEHINSVEAATKKQIESWEKWELIQRKQSIKSLIKEFQINGGVYVGLLKKSEEGKDLSIFNNFILKSLENCLYKSPINNELINYNLLNLYYVIKGHDDILNTTRTPFISEDSKLKLINHIVTDFEKHKEMFYKTREILEEYEQKLT